MRGGVSNSLVTSQPLNLPMLRLVDAPPEANSTRQRLKLSGVSKPIKKKPAQPSKKVGAFRISKKMSSISFFRKKRYPSKKYISQEKGVKWGGGKCTYLFLI